MTALIFGTQGPGSTVLKAIGELAQVRDWEFLLVAAAYASRSGVEQLIGEMRKRHPGWESMRKLFLIGLDFGLTEPEALDRLAAEPGTEVRIYAAEQALASGLQPPRYYHPKVYAFGDRSTVADSNHLGVIHGSANLTAGGLLKNVESFGGVETAVHEQRALYNWLSELEEFALAGDPYTPALREAYVAARLGRPEAEVEPIPDPPAPQEDLSSSYVRSLRAARYFWTQTKGIVENLGQGKPGNQVDLNKAARFFFLPLLPETQPAVGVLGSYFLENGVELHLRYATIGMVKINLPPPGGDFPASYAHQAILWERLPGNRFRLHFDPTGEEWRYASGVQDTAFAYGGGSSRSWGFF